ncbi:hypothetical protein MMIN_06790 [Mycolicibacter minnesotensis]|nr:hypothetical protein MMIN_06790 [Mycolicibacter minnesotensis]
MRQKREPVAGTEAVVLQRGCGTIDKALEFGESQTDIAVDHSYLVRLSAGRASRNVAQRVTARRTEDGIELVHAPDCRAAAAVAGKPRPAQ